MAWVDYTKTVEDTLVFIRRGLRQFAEGRGFHLTISSSMAC